MTELYNKSQGGWLEVEKQFDGIPSTITEEGDLSSGELNICLKGVLKKWSEWERFFEDADHIYWSEASQHLASVSGLLRVIPKSSLYVALDKGNKLLVYLDPFAIEKTFGEDVKVQMERDTEELYSLKRPTLSDNVRTFSVQKNRELNNFDEDQCGVDHLGHWVSRGDFPYICKLGQSTCF